MKIEKILLLASLASIPFNSSVSANDYDVTIRYGSDVDVSEIERDVERIERKGVSVNLESGYYKENCAAVIDNNGNVLFKFGKDSIYGSDLAIAALRVGQGKTPSDLIGSDC